MALRRSLSTFTRRCCNLPMAPCLVASCAARAGRGPRSTARVLTNFVFSLCCCCCCCLVSFGVSNISSIGFVCWPESCLLLPAPRSLPGMSPLCMCVSLSIAAVVDSLLHQNLGQASSQAKPIPFWPSHPILGPFCALCTWRR